MTSTRLVYTRLDQEPIEQVFLRVNFSAGTTSNGVSIKNRSSKCFCLEAAGVLADGVAVSIKNRSSKCFCLAGKHKEMGMAGKSRSRTDRASVFASPTPSLDEPLQDVSIKNRSSKCFCVKSDSMCGCCVTWSRSRTDRASVFAGSTSKGPRMHVLSRSRTDRASVFCARDGLHAHGRQPVSIKNRSSKCFCAIAQNSHSGNSATGLDQEPIEQVFLRRGSDPTDPDARSLDQEPIEQVFLPALTIQSAMSTSGLDQEPIEQVFLPHVAGIGIAL